MEPVGFSVSVSGLKEVLANFKGVKTATRTATKKELAKAGSRIKAAAKNRAPRDKGDLRKAIKRRATRKGLGQRVFADTPVGIWQEFGTVKMHAHPFLFPSLEEERGRLPSLMRGAILTALTTKGGTSSDRADVVFDTDAAG